MARRHQVAAAVLGITATLVAATGTAVATSAGSAPGGSGGPGGSGRAAERSAVRALDAVGAVLTPAGAPDRAAAADPATTRPATARRAASRGTDATLLFRDLVQQQGSLAPAAAARASSYLARPQATHRRCATVCVHWSTSGRDRATSRFAATVLRVVDGVASTYVDAGYRRPLADGTTGGDGRLDVYLRDIGDQGYYGYCTVDREPTGARRTAPAYCVLDNDYAEFARTPVQNLKVTAAHEYFHATQFAYDYDEDRWFLEASATWAEDEVFDGIDDNRQYLRSSQITQQGKPTDIFDQTTWPYGQWIFLRHLTEALPQETGTMPDLVLDMWRLAGTNPGEPNDDSVQAIADALEARGTSLTDQFAAYSWANQTAATSYSEGGAYPQAGFWRDPRYADGRTRLSAAAPDSGVRQVRLRHLASRTSYVTLAPGVAGRAVRVQVGTDADPATTTVTLHLADGTAQVVPLDAAGDGDVTIVPVAGADGVVGFALDAANAAITYDCDQNTKYACAGTPLGDATLAVQYTLQ